MQFFHKRKLNVWAAIIASLLFCPSFLYATERVIENGEAKLIMEFNEGLNIPDGDSLRLVYTGSVSDPSALLRDTSGNPSYWGGSFWSNYSVIFVNPNGINISESARINAASFIASTLDISNDNFLHPEKYNNSYIFSKWIDKAGKSVINNGYIKVREGGQVVLLGSAAANGGTIEATLGSLALAAGEKITLGLDTAGMISVVIDEAVKEEIFGSDGKKLTSAVENSGTIIANGGKVVLAAKVLNKVFDYAVNNSGIIQAKSLVNHKGMIELVGEGEVVVKTVINTGSIIADGTVGLPNGGKISIEAATILHQGLISANAYEEGTGGEIVIISQTSTTVDTGSNTEAKAMGLAGNGGRILINSTGGNTVVNKNAVIDASAGVISGNGGFIEVSAFDQLGFYGVLNGRAPPGYKIGIAILDPEQSTISGEFSLGTTIYSSSGITITGDITLTGAITFNIYADHNSEGASDWHDGAGAITCSGDYTITGTSAILSLKAGSGIGTSTIPIKTNVAELSAENSTSNDIYIDQGSTNLTVTSVVNSASGEMAGIAADGGLLIGWISSDNVGLNASGSIDGLGTQSTNIEARDLVLNAGGNIGANYPLFINAVTFSAYAASGNIGAETSTKIGMVCDSTGALLDGAEVSVVGNDYAITTTDEGFFEIKNVNLTTPVILKITKDGYHTYYSFKSSGRAQNNIYLFSDDNYDNDSGTGFLDALAIFLGALGDPITIDSTNKGLILGMIKDSESEGDPVYGSGVTVTLKDGAVDVTGTTTVYFDPADVPNTFSLTSESDTYTFVIVNVPPGEDYALSAEKTGSEFSTYQVQAFTDGLTWGVVRPLDNSYLRIAIYSGVTTDTDSDGLSDSLEATLGTNPALTDTDSDTLSDYEEYLKYRTNPLFADSDGDGKLDNDWDERREYTYTIKAQGKTLWHAEIADMNDFFQDARSLGTFSHTFTDEHGNVITLTDGLEYEAILYTEAVQLVIPKSSLTYSSAFDSYLDESITITISPEMRAKVEEIVSQIPEAERTDLNIADTLLKWLNENTLDTLSEQYSPSMLSEIVASEDGLRLKYQESVNDYRDDNGEQTFERYEIFSDQQFKSGRHGSCGSTTEIFTGLLRAAGIPTRMVVAVTLVPKNIDAGFYEDLIEDNIGNETLKASLLAFLDETGGGWNHFTPEAYINGQWVRMDQDKPDDVGIGPLQNTIPNIKLFTMVDYTDFALADDGGRLMLGDGPVWFEGDVTQWAIHTTSLEDQDAVHTPSLTLPTKEAASYNSPTAAALQAPVFLQPGVIVVNDAARPSMTINDLRAKDIGAIVAGKDRNLVIDNFTLTGASSEAYIESATKEISMLDKDSIINVDSLDLFAGDTVSLTGNIQDLTATVLIDLSDPKTEGATHDFIVANGSSLDINYIWHNNGNIQISSSNGVLNAVEIITYLGGSITLTNAINTNFSNSQISNSAVFHPVPLDVGSFGQYQFNTFNPSGGLVYFCYPMTPIDMSAFDTLILDDEAYRLIGGKIIMR